MEGYATMGIFSYLLAKATVEAISLCKQEKQGTNDTHNNTGTYILQELKNIKLMCNSIDTKIKKNTNKFISIPRSITKVTIYNNGAKDITDDFFLLEDNAALYKTSIFDQYQFVELCFALDPTSIGSFDVDICNYNNRNDTDDYLYLSNLYDDYCCYWDNTLPFQIIEKMHESLYNVILQSAQSQKFILHEYMAYVLDAMLYTAKGEMANALKRYYSALSILSELPDRSFNHQELIVASEIIITNILQIYNICGLQNKALELYNNHFHSIIMSIIQHEEELIQFCNEHGNEYIQRYIAPLKSPTSIFGLWYWSQDDFSLNSQSVIAAANWIDMVNYHFYFCNINLIEDDIISDSNGNFLKNQTCYVGSDFWSSININVEKLLKQKDELISIF